MGDVDVGHGPARTISAQDTSAVHEMLERLSDDALRARFDGEAMMTAEIYPEIWDRVPEEDDTLSYLMDNVASLRELLAAAAKDGLGLVVWMS